MKRVLIGLAVLAVLFSLSFAQAQQKAAGVTVSRIAACERVENREPVAADSIFVGVEKLCCFTEIHGAAEPTFVHHVWYRGDKEMARIKLTVGAARWRTYSSKKIIPSWTGDWRVDILDAQGKRISLIAFQIK